MKTLSAVNLLVALRVNVVSLQFIVIVKAVMHVRLYCKLFMFDNLKASPDLIIYLNCLDECFLLKN